MTPYRSISRENPKIIQRKARHRKIETTLRYDHVSDEVVREYFKEQKVRIKSGRFNGENSNNQETEHINPFSNINRY